MNLFFRLFIISFMVRFKPPMDVLDPCRTTFRCWPTDLDVLRHMNNGKYCSLMDLARVDLMGRSGLLKEFAKRGWYPVVTAETIRFKKSLGLFDRFEIETVVIGWDEKAFLVRQRFLKGGQVISEAVVRARFLKKSGGSVESKEIMKLAGINSASPQLEPWIEAWNNQQK
jgi:acyl-CoA thioesterase FadM